MIIIACGGRIFGDTKKERLLLKDALDPLDKVHSIYEVIEGGAKGADTLAGRWADYMGIVRTTVPANWKSYGNAAGYKRNREMLDLLLTKHHCRKLVVAFPGGTGTDMMVKIARSANVDVWQPTYCDYIY